MPTEKFKEVFGAGEAFLARGPGRVNLIGEHTDYNGGYVLPAAIDADVQIAFRPADDGVLDVLSLNFNERRTIDLNKLDEYKTGWVRYPAGVAWALKQEGRPLRGMKAVMKGSLPIGSGLSSSAAVEVASCMALCETSGIKLNREKMALICHKAETDFVGLKCGIMDQFASLMGRKGNALFLNCSTLEHDLVPLDDEKARIVVCDSKVERTLSDTPYNDRRKECAAAFLLLKQHAPEIRDYRDISPALFKAYAYSLPEVPRKRARHVVTENQRVLHAVKVLRVGDLISFGALLDASHDSLRDDYEASCPELDILVDLARSVIGTFGSRLTGAGWGGCTVSLVRPDAVDEFKRVVSEGYRARTGKKPGIHIFRPAEGATVERIMT